FAATRRMEDIRPLDPATASAQIVASEFHRRFVQPCRVFRAPGRVNLIGEHTDYNDGFVMPAALGFCTYVAAAALGGRTLTVHSLDFNETVALDLDALPPGATGHWSDYVRGVAAVLQARGLTIVGASLAIKGDVPIGAGLSSSAAVEVATAFALLAVSGVSLDRRVIAEICQRAEHEYAGTKCGIMDQFISCLGQASQALLLDCRSLQYDPLPVPDGVRIVICNSMVKHALAGGEYNLRRADCEAGIQVLRRHFPGIQALRDVTASQLQQYSAEMPERIYRRCRHVVSENARTLAAAAELRGGDVARFGSLMYESHASLRDDYAVSCSELDLLVELARKCAGVFGARMTGGGFGGCTVNLVEANVVEAFQAEVARRYENATGKRPAIYVCAASPGAGEVGVQSA
ncbi:MAG TPA: galactokinase, partial [Candidatus Angelobacter sp.]|nr:galactokinase [Candidatus Angelobacter sp.]